MSLIEWFDSLLPIPADYEFLKYLILGTVVVFGVLLFFGTISSLFSAIFGRR